MANRSYLYSLSNQPTSYADRLETVTGLSEWAYNIPFLYRLLASANPALCASLISDTLDDVAVPLHAVTSSFDPGFDRVQRFAAIVKAIPSALQTPPAPEPAAPSFIDRLRNLIAKPESPAPSAPQEPAIQFDHLSGWLDEAITFLKEHRDQYVLLETIELDTMDSSDPAALRKLVEQEIELCRQAGLAVDALPQDTAAAARLLHSATIERKPAPLDAFFGLSLNDECDGGEKAATYPLGLAWDAELYFSLMNRKEFEEHQRDKA